MPRPVYQLCANDVSIDSLSNILSIFGIIERINVEAFTAPPDSPTDGIQGTASIPFSGKLVSVWLAEETDHGAMFHHSVSVVAPDGSELVSITLPDFTMMTTQEKPLHRLLIELRSLPPMCQSGVWYLVSRICRAESEETNIVVQRYPIHVSFVEKVATPQIIAQLKHERGIAT